MVSPLVERPRASTDVISALRRSLCSLVKQNWELDLKPKGGPGRGPGVRE
ncbi:MAG: hypothetical protein MUP61_02890 [Burkholderiales bacterium]|nr:hypothetical protein [Burkholderiales bacterium]